MGVDGAWNVVVELAPFLAAIANLLAAIAPCLAAIAPYVEEIL